MIPSTVDALAPSGCRSGPRIQSESASTSSTASTPHVTRGDTRPRYVACMTSGNTAAMTIPMTESGSYPDCSAMRKSSQAASADVIASNAASAALPTYTAASTTGMATTAKSTRRVSSEPTGLCCDAVAASPVAPVGDDDVGGASNGRGGRVELGMGRLPERKGGNALHLHDLGLFGLQQILEASHVFVLQLLHILFSGLLLALAHLLVHLAFVSLVWTHRSVVHVADIDWQVL